VRVLVSAYACEPGKGSEPGIGWNWVCQIARFHEVWAITRANNQDPIESALARNPIPNIHFSYYDLPRWCSFWKKERRGIHLYYYLWQLGAYFLARKLHREVNFDLVHHVTFVNYWMPGFLALLPIPFIWGPVGGGESAPRPFWRSYSLRGKVYELLRDLARRWGELDPFVGLTARRAAVGLATTHQTEERLRVLGCRNVCVFSQVGLPQDEIRRLTAFPFRQSNPFRLISAGDLLHLKGFELGLRAFARFQSQFPAAEYWIIGDGPERKRLEMLALKLHIADKVMFTGAILREEVLEKLAECNVLLHPALHESGGWVTLEAMAAGRPVICLDLGGSAEIVTSETGIKVPAVSPDQAVGDLVAAMSQLAQDPTLCARLGCAGRQRVQERFNWDKKGTCMIELYQRLLSNGTPLDINALAHPNPSPRSAA
jgi:glycosyltransferase involved in cell wall biosynthesis